jgi:hypothetical protein
MRKICKYCRFWQCSAPIRDDQSFRLDKRSGFCFRFFYPKPPTDLLAAKSDDIKQGDSTILSIHYNQSGRQLFVTPTNHHCVHFE